MINHFFAVLFVLAFFTVTGAWLAGYLPAILPVLRLKMLEAMPHKLRNLKNKPRTVLQYIMILAGLGLQSNLSAIHYRVDPATGRQYVLHDYGTISRRFVTTAGVTFLANAFINTAEPEIMNYHATGTGAVAENIADTALGAEVGTRVAGTQSSPSAGVYRTVATVTYGAGFAITEHGIFSQLATGGTLWDRSVFAALNVVNTDSVQYTYNLTITAGG